MHFNSAIRQLKYLLLQFYHSEIVKVFSLSSLATLVRMLTGMISIKVVAIIIGPTGVALLGQLNNFIYIVQYLSCGAINNGIVKYVSEYKTSFNKTQSALANALIITVVCSLLCGIIMIIFHSYLSRWIMLSPEYGYVFAIFGITVILYALNILLVSIVNGYKAYKTYIKINIANSITGLFFTVFFTWLYGLQGALICATTYQSIVCFITLYMIRKQPWASLKYFKGRINKRVLKNYLKYALMTFVTIGTMPVAQILIRRYIMITLSGTEAGWWEAMNRISNIYLLMISTSFGVYYLPRLAEINNLQELRQEIYKAFKIIIPILLGGFFLIYVFRFLIIKTLFTSDFVPMAQLFGWQMTADLFKVGCYILTYVMIAKAHTIAYITTEILFTFVYIGFVYLLTSLGTGILGVVQAGIVAYLLHLGVAYIYMRKIGYI